MAKKVTGWKPIQMAGRKKTQASDATGAQASR